MKNKHFEKIKELNLILGYSCNNHCLFCCERGNSGDRNTEDLKKEIKSASNSGFRRIVFTGGEPTIRKDIIELIKYAKELGYVEIFIITNGRMLSYKKFANKIVDAGVTHILFSLHAPNAKVHNFLTQSENAYSQIVKGMKNVRERVVIENNTVLTKYNYKLFPKLADFLIHKINVNYFEAIFMNPVSSLENMFNKLVPRISDVSPYVLKALKKGRDNNVWCTAEGIPLCHLPGFESQATELYMFENRLLSGPGNRRVDNINKSRENKAKIKPKRCEKCKYYDICEGIWGNYVKLYGDKELIPKMGKKITNKKELRKPYKPILLS